MTPPIKLDHSPTWNVIAKISIAIIGAMLTAALSWFARASEKSAQAFLDLKDVVYNGQTKIAVIEGRLTTNEKEQERMDTRVKRIEAKLFEGVSK